MAMKKIVNASQSKLQGDITSSLQAANFSITQIGANHSYFMRWKKNVAVAMWLVLHLGRVLDVEGFLKGNQVLDVRMVRIEGPVFAPSAMGNTMRLSVALQVPVATRETLFVLDIGIHSSCQNPAEIVEFSDVAVVSQRCPSCSIVPSSDGSHTKESVGGEI